MEQTFNKKERITGEKRIETLFSGGDSFVAYPMRVVFLKTDVNMLHPVSVLISVPKKRIKSAVKRNRVKRMIREAYRLNKHQVVLGSSHVDVAFIYLKDDLSDYATIEKGMIKALKELSHRNEAQLTEQA